MQALEAGFGPIKINMVVKRGVNEQEIIPMARRFSGEQFILRFIEFMDVANSNHWRMQEWCRPRRLWRRYRRSFLWSCCARIIPGEVAQRFRHAERARGDRDHRFGDAAFLPGLHTGAGFFHGQFLHVCLRRRA